jgi:hypothetical protein
MATTEIGLLNYGIGPQSQSFIDLATMIKIQSFFMQPFDIINQTDAALITKPGLLGNSGLTTGAMHSSSSFVKNSRWAANRSFYLLYKDRNGCVGLAKLITNFTQSGLKYPV